MTATKITRKSCDACGADTLWLTSVSSTSHDDANVCDACLGYTCPAGCDNGIKVDDDGWVTPCIVCDETFESDEEAAHALVVLRGGSWSWSYGKHDVSSPWQHPRWTR